MAGYQVKPTVQDYIATVVMDRPPVNAQNTEFREELIAAFDASLTATMCAWRS